MDSLRDDYMESIHSYDENEWPPNQPKTVVNVTLIHYEDSHTEQELIEISTRRKKGASAIDELAHHCKVTKDIAKIFNADFINSEEAIATCSESPKFILIEGAPGIGKTVLAKQIAYLWAKKELLVDVNILFLLFLRDPDLQSIETTDQLIQYLSNKCLNKAQVKTCVEQVMELKIAVVMDGFDEYPIKLRKKSFIANIIKGKVFQKSIIVLTSRPSATIFLYSKVDRRVEILGFTQEDRDNYISESLHLPGQKRELIDYLKCHPVINGLIYVPLHLAILLYLFKFQSKLPETLTEMNESFILHTIYRSLTKHQVLPVDTNIVSIKDLPENILEIVNRLSKLAFVGLQNNQLVFSHADIKRNCSEIESDITGAFSGFGLLQVVQHFPRKGAGTTVSFNFLHFTMQEYLAALHVSNITVFPVERQLSLMKETFWNETYNFMWMMYAGINGINSQTLVRFLYRIQPGADDNRLKLSSKIKSDKLKCLYLFQCFMEAKCEEIPSEISFMFNNKINFRSVQLLPHHISSLILYISKHSVQLQSLNLRDCHIGDIGMRMLEHFFTANPDKATGMKYIDLFGNNSLLLWNVFCAMFGKQNLTKLKWSSLKLGGMHVEDIANVMNNNKTVQSLNISDNHFQDKDAERISQVLTNNTTLQKLDFLNNNITTKGAIAVSELMQNSITLKCLKLSWNDYFINTNHSKVSLSQKLIKDVGAKIVSKVLCNNENVIKLDLSCNNISGTGAGSISECIKINKSLQEIDISSNEISNIGLKKLADALQVNIALLRLNISYNNISNDGAVAISKCLRNNNTLQELNMSHNEVCNNGIANIARALEVNTSLRLLDISHNKISDDKGTISNCLKKTASLQELNMSYNIMPNHFLVNIGVALQVNKTLQVLDISNNEMFDDGILNFSNYLKENNNLQKLKISWNKDIYLDLDSTIHSCAMSEMKLGDTETILISAFLVSSNNITKLDISHNYITDDGAVAISECLNYNNTLKEVYISDNEITSEGVMTILKSIDSNSPLHTLDLTHNIVTKSELGIIHSVYKQLKNLSSFQISYYEIVDDFQNINAVLVHFDNEHKKLSSSSKIKLEMHHKSTTYKAKVLCFCAKENNVKSLDISKHGITIDVAKIITKAIQQSTLLWKLNISYNEVSNDGAMAISEYLKNNNTLQKLNISYNNISDKGIISISNALHSNETLQKFDISHNSISDYGAVAISECLKNNRTLQGLKMSHNNISDDGIISIGKALQINMTLQTFDVSCNKFSSSGVFTFSNYYKENNVLHSLRISWNDIVLNLNSKAASLIVNAKRFDSTGAILISASLYHNVYIQKLDISGSNISNEGTVAIGKFLEINSTLKELNISNNYITNHGITNITQAIQINTTLRSLDISQNDISRNEEVVTALSNHLKYNNTLEVLRISWNEVLGISWNEILETSCNEITYVYVAGVSKKCYVRKAKPNSRVRQISSALNRHNYSYEEYNHWPTYFEECEYFNDTVDKLQFDYYEALLLTALLYSNICVNAIEIVKSEISDSAASVISDFLQSNKTIHKFKLSQNAISMKGIEEVMKAMQTNTTLQTLDISSSNISDDGGIAISGCIKNNNVLQNLNISYNKICDAGITHISEALQTNITLRTIDISHNNISDEGALTISQILRNQCKDIISTTNGGMAKEDDIQGSVVQRIDISYNNISSKGIIALSDCLINNNTLQELTISWINCKATMVLDSTIKVCLHHEKGFGDIGAILISSFFFHNNILQILDVSSNNISDSGAVAISEYLKASKTLQELHMSNNNITNDGIIRITEAIQTNTTLRLLDVSHNNLHRCQETVATLSAHIKHNNALKILGISWDDTNNTYVYATGVNTECYIDNILPKSEWVDNTVHYVRQYNNEESDDSSEFDDWLNVDHKLRFDDVEALLLTALLHDNVHVKTLDITKCKISDSTSVAVTISDCLKANKILEKLKLQNNTISSKTLEQIMKSVQTICTLCTLDISSSNITDIGAVAVSEYLKANKTLKELHMSNNRITNDGIMKITEAIQTNATLRLLDVSHNDLHRCKETVATSSAHLEHNSTLKVLGISWDDYVTTDIDVIYVYAIGVNNECHVDSTWPKPAWTNNTVCYEHKLDWGSENAESVLQFNNDEVIVLTALIHGNFVSSLQIVRCEISESTAIAISDFLKTDKTLKKLKLSLNIISVEAIEEIIKSIQTNSTLEILDISSNNVSDHNAFDDGTVAITECLQHNETLKELDISNNNITIKIIMDSTQVNTTLVKLFIHRNRIFEDGILVISEYLAKNTTLQELSLSWDDSPTKEGITKIAKAMAVNTGLHTLDLSSQHVNDPIHFTMTLLMALEHNDTITRLVLPTDVDISETQIKVKMDKINKERNTKGRNTLVLASYTII